MIRRLSMASALVHDPEVLVLDEPSLGLDPKGLESLWSLLLRLASGKTLISQLITRMRLKGSHSGF